jgi:Ni/Fe-hydrogenase subunit HybB-like protein
VTPEAIGRAIQLILAPVVMFSACSVFVGGVLNHYTSVSDRIRALTRERLELLRDPSANPLAQERLAEIDAQLPDVLDRHRLIHHALLAVYASIAILISTMCIIAVTASITAEWVGALVYGVFVLGVLAMLVGVVLVTLEIRTSRRSIEFEVERVKRLPARVTDTPFQRTVNA